MPVKEKEKKTMRHAWSVIGVSEEKQNRSTLRHRGSQTQAEQKHSQTPKRLSSRTLALGSRRASW